jgi:hypothetical protein
MRYDQCAPLPPPVGFPQSTLKNQLIVSTALMTPAVYLISIYALPSEFSGIFVQDPERLVKNW